MGDRKTRWLLAAIVAAGLVLRLMGIDFGLPRLYQSDEEFFVTPALRIADGTWDPGWYGAPGQPLIYGLGIAFRLTNAVLNAHNGTALPASLQYREQVTAFQTVGRLIPALLGTATIIVVYLLGALWSRPVGLMAAAMLAFNFYHVDHSHIIRPDVPQTFFVLLALFGGIKILAEPHRIRWYLVLGAGLGIAVTMKYPSLFLVPTILLLAWLLVRRKVFRLRLWALMAGTALGAAFLTGPFLFLRGRGVLDAVAFENRALHGEHGGFGFWGNLWWYLADVLHWQMGTLFAIVAVAAFGWVAYRLLRTRTADRRREILAVLILASGTYLVLLSFLNLRWERWTLPVATILMVPAAAGIGTIWLRCRTHRLPGILLCIALVAGPLVRLGRTLNGYTHPSTVERARTWMLENIPDGAILAVEPYAPDPPGQAASVVRVPNLSVKTLDEYRQSGVTHAVLTESVHGVIERQARRSGPASSWAAALRGYGALFASSELVFEQRANPRYTADELLYSADWSVLRTLRLDLVRGPYVRIFRFPND